MYRAVVSTLYNLFSLIFTIKIHSSTTRIKMDRSRDSAIKKKEVWDAINAFFTNVCDVGICDVEMTCLLSVLLLF